MTAMRPDILLVIPAYREHLRLPAFLRDLVSRLGPSPYSVDILVVDDGSPAQEFQALAGVIDIGTHGRCRVLPPIVLERNLGKGAAILAGWRSETEALFYSFVDADGAISATEVARILAFALNGDHRSVIFATRVQMLGRKIERRPYRHLSGRIFANIVNLIFRSGAYDTQCGFKILPFDLFRRADPFLKGAGLCFDIEVMLALHHTGACIEEKPIDWKDMAGGRIVVWRHSWKMVWELMRLHFRVQGWRRANMTSSGKSSLANLHQPVE